MQTARKKVLVADSSKWSASAPVTYGNLVQVNAVITDEGLAAEHRAAVEEAGVELILV